MRCVDEAKLRQCLAVHGSWIFIFGSSCNGDVSMKALFRSFEQNLSGWPDTILSVALVTSGIAVILVGMFAPRTVKLLILGLDMVPVDLETAAKKIARDRFQKTGAHCWPRRVSSCESGCRPNG